MSRRGRSCTTSALLAWVGCYADSYEQARWFGDDISAQRKRLHGRPGRVEQGPVRDAATSARAAAPARRALTALQFMALGGVRRWSRCTGRIASSQASSREGSGSAEPVRSALLDNAFERWDGKGHRRVRLRRGFDQPAVAAGCARRRRRGAPPARVASDAAVAVARKRSGTQFDPEVVDVLLRRGTCSCSAPLARRDELGCRDRCANQALQRPLSDAELDEALEAIADFADLKSPYTMGHSARGRRPGGRRPRRSAGCRTDEVDAAQGRARPRPRPARTSRTRSGTSPDRLPPSSASGYGYTRT